MNQRLLVPLLLMFSACSGGAADINPTADQTQALEVEQAMPGRHGPLREAIINTKFGPQQVVYEEIDGLAIFEGDIVLGTIEEMATSKKNVGLWQDSSNWLDRTIPYRIESEFGSTMVGRINDAMAHWHDMFGFNFVPRTTESEYVYFQTGSGCSSELGKRSPTHIELGSCSTGSIIHEIGHAVGLRHTHSRCDRDLHVKIWPERIDPSRLHNFDKQCGSNHWDVAWWDTQSIMHYGSDAFQAEGVNEPTMTLADGVTTFSAQRTALTNGDLQAVREIYYYQMPAVLLSAVVVL